MVGFLFVFLKITNMILPLQIKIHNGKKNSAECKEDARTTMDYYSLAKTCNNRSPDPVPRSHHTREGRANLSSDQDRREKFHSPCILAKSSSRRISDSQW